MKPGFGTRGQLLAFLAALAVLLAIFVRWRSAPPAPAAGARATQATRRTGSAPDADDGASSAPGPRRGNEKKPASAQDVPFVSKDLLDPPRTRGQGDGARNIFDLRPPTPIPPPTPTPGLPPPPPAGSQAFVGPLPPPTPTPTPAPPEINFKFIGTFGPKDRPVAVLVLGDQVVNARAGDVVFDRYVVRRVGYESVDVGFKDYFIPSETRRIGITP